MAAPRRKGATHGVMPQVQLMVACENATLDMQQNLSLTSIYERLLAPGFPTMSPSFYVVFAFQNVLPKIYSTKLTVEHSDGTQLLSQELHDNAVPSHQKKIRIVLNLRNFIWPKPGEYTIKLFLSGIVAAAFTLELAEGSLAQTIITPPPQPPQ